MHKIATVFALSFLACDKPPAATVTPPAEVATRAPAAPAMTPPAHTTPSPPSGGELPAGHPPVTPAAPSAPTMGPGMGRAVPAESGVARPLPLEGAGSVAELTARLAKVGDAAKRTTLEDAFRKVFTVARAERDAAGAEAQLTPLAGDADSAVAALAERTLGYVRVSRGFDAEGAKTRYQRAIELDPEYGEAHYALAFMLAMGDREKAKVHFDKAMALGVPDTRGLRDQFFGAP